MIAIAALLFSLLQAQDIPPPPRPKDNGPSLEETMKFLEEKLGSIGRVNFIAYYHDNTAGTDWTKKYSAELTKVRASAPTCALFFHSFKGGYGDTALDGDMTFPLKPVQEVLVMTHEQWAKVLDSKFGHPEFSSRVDPPVFVISPRAKVKDWTPFWAEVILNDETLANRVAKALTHAVELCGGGNKDPF